MTTRAAAITFALGTLLCASSAGAQAWATEQGAQACATEQAARHFDRVHAPLPGAGHTPGAPPPDAVCATQVIDRQVASGSAREGFRETAIIRCPTEPAFVVLAALHRSGSQELVASTSLWMRGSARARVRELAFGPGLLYVEVLGGEEDRLELYSFDAQRGLVRVLELTTRGAGIDSARLAYDAGTRTLTITEQPRLPPHRSRCMRPAPRVSTARWDGQHFVDRVEAPGSSPCGG